MTTQDEIKAVEEYLKLALQGLTESWAANRAFLAGVSWQKSRCDCEALKGQKIGLEVALAVTKSELAESRAENERLIEILRDVYTHDEGNLSDYGGGNVSWWHDYIRAIIDRIQSKSLADASGEENR